MLSARACIFHTTISSRLSLNSRLESMKLARSHRGWIANHSKGNQTLTSIVKRQNTSRLIATIPPSCSAATRSSSSSSIRRNPQSFKFNHSSFAIHNNRNYSQTAASSNPTPTQAATPSPSSLTSLATSTASLFDPQHPWSTTILESTHQLSKVNSRPITISVIGSTHSQTSRLLEAFLDEPFSYASENTSEQEAAAERATTISLIQERRQLAASLQSKRRSEPASDYGSDLKLTEGLKVQYAPSAHLGFPSTSDASTSSMPALGVPLPWLREGSGIEIIELLDPTSTPSESLLSTLYSSDLILFHTDLSSIRSSSRADPVLSLLSRFAEKPGTRLLVDDSAGDSSPVDLDSSLESVLGPVTLKGLKKQIRFTSSESSNQSSAAVLISTRLALRANSSLRTALEIDADSSNSSSITASVWESFRSNHVASNFPSIRALLSPSSLPSPAASSSHSLTFVLRQALSAAASQVSSARQEIEYSKGASSALREVAQSEMESKEFEVLQGAKKWAGNPSNVVSTGTESSRWKIPGLDTLLGRSKDVETRAGDLPSSSSLSIGETTESHSGNSAPLASSAGAISATLGNRLAWWKVAGLGRVDDVRTEVEGAVIAGWGRKAEEWLIFEAGRMLSVAQHQSQKTNSILESTSKNTRSSNSLRSLSDPISGSESSTSIFSSSLLRNSIEAHSPSRLQMFSSPLLLSSPIAQRRSQLLSPGGPLDALVRGGQKAVFQSWLIGGSGVGISLLGLGTGAGLRLGLLEHFPGFSLSSIAMEPSTSLALALFSILLAAWRMQGRWAKEKKRFWKRWESIANGLEEDVQVQLRNVLKQGVYITPIVASEGIDELIKKREEKIRLVEKEVVKAIRDGREIGVLETEESKLQ